IHPPGRNEMIAITPPIIFSKEVAQKQATPLPHQQPPLTTRNRFTPNFRGWRLDEFSIFARPPPRGVSPHARPHERNSPPMAAAGRDQLFAYAAAATLASSASSKGRAKRCTVLGFTSNLAAVLRTLMPPARAVLIRSASLSAIGGRPRRLPSRLARCKPARTRSWIIECSNSAKTPSI